MPIVFNRFPYYDDFTTDSQYYRLLFQPGRSVQARELTQIQTLLQSQIDVLGGHIFDEGARVAFGEINYSNDSEKWLAVKAQDAHGNPVRIRDLTPGLLIRKPSDATDTNAVHGKITSVIPSEGNDPNTIYFQWVIEPDNPRLDGFLANQMLHICDPRTGAVRYNVTTLDVNSLGNDIHYGTSSSISVAPGIYFYNGMFIKSNGGNVRLSKYSNRTNYIVGYAINEEIVTDDPRSLDPAQHASNYSAPGADRYKINMTLVKIGDGTTIDDRAIPDFLEVCRIVDGNLIAANDGTNDLYNELAKAMAKRTYEESGNYVAKPYDLVLSDKISTDNPKVKAKMTSGVSYVKGFRHSLNEKSIFTFDKARDALEEDTNLLNHYGDNYLLVYDEANTSISSHPENANGVFTVGSGAGVDVSTAPYALKGEAVAIHCVPQHLVIDHSLTSNDTWHSTLVGTARPFQQVYNRMKSTVSHRAGRKGDVYNLWLGDFKSSPSTNTVAVDNIIEEVNGAANTTFTTFYFSSKTHGITANDRISITGSQSSGWNIDNHKVTTANSFAIVVPGQVTTESNITDGSLTLYRTAGNVSPFNTVVLDSGSSAAWNGSYVGSTIQVGNSTPRKIVDYIGTSSTAETLYNSRNGFSKRGLVILDSALDEIPKRGDRYHLNLTMKQARSVVFNQNKSATGVDQYPAILNQAWNVDPISGIENGSVDILLDDVYGRRIDGDALYNRYGASASGEDSLLFSPRRSAIKTYQTFGSLDTGLTSNTIAYYTEYTLTEKSGAATTAQFTTPNGANDYKYFNRPKPWPFDVNFDSNSGGLDHVKENFILYSRTTGKILTSAITRVQVNVSTHVITVTLPATNQFLDGETYILMYPVRAEFVEPAYKKLIKGNTVVSHASHFADNRNNSLSNFEYGHAFFQDGTYDTGPGAKLSLQKPDGFKLRAVIQNLPNADANNQIANTVDQARTTPLYHITDHFNFYTGQRDMFYDNAYIELKDGYNAPAGNVLVIFDRFERMDKPKSDSSRAKEIKSPSFFNVDSYQWTTDLTLDHASGYAASIDVGTKMEAKNTNISGYVVDYANTGSSYAKVRLQGVYGPPGSNGQFSVGENIKWTISDGTTKESTIKSVVYADLGYSEIPVYRSSGQRSYPLTNMLDFRPYVVTNNMVSDTISDGVMPIIPSLGGINAGRYDGSTVSPMTKRMSTPVTFEHFGGRIDKIVVDEFGVYRAVKGNPAVVPFPPKDLSDDSALTLFQVNIPPYTFSPKDIEIKPTFAMRHTMKDIGRLAKRVENLEYYVALNALEKSASDMDIRSKDGSTRFKNGIVVDNFMGSMVMDFSESNAAVGGGFLRSQVEQPDNQGSYHFKRDQGSTFSGLKEHHRKYTEDSGGGSPDFGRVTTLDYDVEPMITQASATTTESVNPFDLQNYTGELSLTPDKDTWIDITKVPEYNSFVNNTLDSIAGVDENSDIKAIMNAIRSIDDFWVDVAGNKSIGDDPMLHGSSFYREDLTSQTESMTRDITLGNVRDQYFNTAPIDSAIAMHGLTDGVTKNVKILPYIRSRDVIVDARGLKPNHLNTMIFDGISVENHFAQANRIYMGYDPEVIRAENEDLTGKLFQPDIDGTYEKIKLTSGGKTANAVLLAVREAELQNGITNGPNSRYMVGYIIPEFDADTGLIDYDTYADGYYTGWSDSEIRAHGFQGYFGQSGSTQQTVTGYSSGASAGLIAWGGPTSMEPQKYNGHYTGTARNASSNTTHIVLSPDAHRYRPENFRRGGLTGTVDTYDSGIPEKSRINIVAGAGAGQECVANGIIYVDSAGRPVIELRSTPDGTTGISVDNPIDGTSVYTIGMRHIDPKKTKNSAVAKIGDTPSRSNLYGEKLGVLRIPSTSKTKFTTGRKLVEVANRFGRQEWLITSYASAYYFAEGKEIEQVEASPNRLDMLKEIRSRSNGYRILDHPDDTGVIPATNNDDGSTGILAVVTGIEIANGSWTALSTDDITFRPGGGEFGTVDFAEQEYLTSTLMDVWRHLKDEYPEIYEKYYSQYGSQE